MATVVYVSPVAASSQLLALGVCIGLAVLVLIAHLARPAVKKFIAAMSFALAVSSVAAATVHADEGDGGVVIGNICKDLTPSDWEYWVYGCMWP